MQITSPLGPNVTFVGGETSIRSKGEAEVWQDFEGEISAQDSFIKFEGEWERYVDGGEEKPLPEAGQDFRLRLEDQDGKPNLFVKLEREDGQGRMVITNPGSDGQLTELSLPLGDVSEAPDSFFEPGFFPSAGVESVEIEAETLQAGDATEYNFNLYQGESTYAREYNVYKGRIYEA